jgi:arginine repressor
MTAHSSIVTYHNEIKGSKENNQDSIILSAFVAIGKPATARMVQKYLKDIGIEYESSTIARSTNNLHAGKLRKPRIVFVMEDKCEVTKRTANYYEAILKLGTQASLRF